MGFSSQQRIHGFTAHCDHRNRNVSQCPCFPCTYLTFSFMRCWRADPHGQQTRAHNIATHGLSPSSWLVAPVNVTSSYCTRQPASAMVRKGLWAHIIHIQPIAPLTYMHKHIGTDVTSNVTLSRRVHKNILYFNTCKAHSALHNYALNSISACIVWPAETESGGKVGRLPETHWAKREARIRHGRCTT